MKQVSYKVAKAIKDAGYPQVFIDCAYYEDNKLHHTEDPYNNCHTIIAYAPTYIEIWLWLWREKKIAIDIITDKFNTVMALHGEKNIEESVLSNDPEEAIIAAIEYLVDNDIIK